MVNYGDTKIYKIWSPKGPDIYIGSTTSKLLSKRLGQHKSHYRNNHGFATSYKLFDMYGEENCYIELLEAKSCISKDEQHKLEGEYISKMKCINSRVPNRKWTDWTLTNETPTVNNHQSKVKCICGCIMMQSRLEKHKTYKSHFKNLVYWAQCVVDNKPIPKHFM